MVKAAVRMGLVLGTGCVRAADRGRVKGLSQGPTLAAGPPESSPGHPQVPEQRASPAARHQPPAPRLGGQDSGGWTCLRVQSLRTS